MQPSLVIIVGAASGISAALKGVTPAAAAGASAPEESALGGGSVLSVTIEDAIEPSPSELVYANCEKRTSVPNPADIPTKAIEKTAMLTTLAVPQ